MSRSAISGRYHMNACTEYSGDCKRALFCGGRGGGVAVGSKSSGTAVGCLDGGLVGAAVAGLLFCAARVWRAARVALGVALPPLSLAAGVSAPAGRATLVDSTKTSAGV